MELLLAGSFRHTSDGETVHSLTGTMVRCVEIQASTEGYSKGGYKLSAKYYTSTGRDPPLGSIDSHRNSTSGSISREAHLSRLNTGYRPRTTLQGLCCFENLQLFHGYNTFANINSKRVQPLSGLIDDVLQDALEHLATAHLEISQR